MYCYCLLGFMYMHPQSCLTLCDPMDCAYQDPPSMGLSQQGYWSGYPLSS